VWHLALATCREVFGKIPVFFLCKEVSADILNGSESKTKQSTRDPTTWI